MNYQKYGRSSQLISSNDHKSYQTNNQFSRLYATHNYGSSTPTYGANQFQQQHDSFYRTTSALDKQYGNNGVFSAKRNSSYANPYHVQGRPSTPTISDFNLTHKNVNFNNFLNNQDDLNFNKSSQTPSQLQASKNKQKEQEKTQLNFDSSVVQIKIEQNQDEKQKLIKELEKELEKEKQKQKDSDSQSISQVLSLVSNMSAQISNLQAVVFEMQKKESSYLSEINSLKMTVESQQDNHKQTKQECEQLRIKVTSLESEWKEWRRLMEEQLKKNIYLETTRNRISNFNMNDRADSMDQDFFVRAKNDTFGRQQTNLKDLIENSNFDEDSGLLEIPNDKMIDKQKQDYPRKSFDPCHDDGVKIEKRQVVQMARFNSQNVMKKGISMYSNTGMSSFFNQTDNQPINIQQQRLDMVFLFADPLVISTEHGALLEYDIRLDLDEEYEQIQVGLQNADKAFSIKKEAITIDSLQQVMKKNRPKIIHISCHGSYDSSNLNDKQFYLSIENQDADGSEFKLKQKKLEDLLGVNRKKDNQGTMGIKLAFVSACQSEEIGKIFFDSGIPVVIAVNANQGIMDSACKIFSSQFYHELLLGSTIEESFECARAHVRVADCGQYETCCCAHPHSPDCAWYKLYQQDPQKAHEMHNKNCPCKKLTDSNQAGGFQRHHLSTCRVFKEFLTKMAELKKQFGINSDQIEGQKATIKPEGSKLGGLAGLVGDSDDSEFMDQMELEEEFKNAEQFLIPVNASKEDLIMCCCCPEMPHDESMKFVLKRNSDLDLKTKIFELANPGILKVFDNQDSPQIHNKIDKNQLAGRQQQIHEILKFLNGSQKKKILFINGEAGQGCSHLAKFSIKYIMDRGHIKQGAYFIDAEKIISEANLVHVVQKKLELFDDFDNILPFINKKDMLFCFDNCKNLIKNDGENFFIFLQKFNELISPKILIISNEANHENLEKTIQNSKLKYDYSVLKIENLKREQSIKVIYQMCQQNEEFTRQFPCVTDLGKHKLFNEELEFTPAMITEIGMLIKEGMNIDQIYDEQKQLISQKHEQKEYQKEQKNNMMMMLVYEKLVEQRKDIINIVNLLAIAPEGLLLFDLIRIVYLNQQAKPNHECIQFGDWLQFLRQESQEQKIMNIKIIENIRQTQYQANPQIQEIIQNINRSQKKGVIKQYLRYMSLLSRQLLRDIKLKKELDFDPYIVSSQIDSGLLWTEPKILEDDFKKRNPDYSNEGDHQIVVTIDEIIQWSVQHFWFHEPNFLDILFKYRWYIEDEAHQLSDSDSIIYMQELCINLPSIYLMLQKQALADNVIKQIELICNKKDEFNETFAKLKLIQSSMKLKYETNLQVLEINNILDECQQLFHRVQKEGIVKEGLAEIKFIKGLSNTKKIRQLLKEKENKVEQSNWNTKKQQNQNINSEIEEQLKKAEKYLLKDSNHGIINTHLVSSKSCLIYAELIVDLFTQNLSLITLGVTNQMLIQLQNSLEQKKDELSLESNILCVKCMYYIACINFKLKDFQKCQKYVNQCISFSRDLGLIEIQQKIQNLKHKLHDIEINNYFVFAKSSSLINIEHLQKNMNSFLFTQIQDEQLALKAVLTQSGKQINVKFDVLTFELLEHIRDHGCKILHLSPCMFEISKDLQYLKIEDKQNNLFTISPEQLKNKLMPKNGKLKISIVIIDQINCFNSFAQVFNDLGVEHVITFEIYDQNMIEIFKNNNLDIVSQSSQISQQLKSQLLPQKLLIYASSYFIEFALKFYLLIAQNYSVTHSVLESQKAADQNALYSHQFNLIKPMRKQDSLAINDKLFNDEKTKLVDGLVLDVSDMRAPTNIQMDKYETKYLIQNVRLFLQLFETLFDQQISGLSLELNRAPSSTELRASQIYQKKTINIHGPSGVGKSRLVNEFVRYIHYRYTFQGGIYETDLSQYQTFEEVHDILNDYLQQKGSELFNSRKSDEYIREYKQQSGQFDYDILFIFDNCDEIFKNCRTHIELQLSLLHKKFKNLHMIFISKEKLDKDFNFSYIRVQPMSQVCSILFTQSLQTQNQQIVEKADQQSVMEQMQMELDKTNKIFEISKGIPQLIKLLNLINYYGLTHQTSNLLDKISIRPLSQQISQTQRKQANMKVTEEASMVEETLRSVLSTQKVMNMTKRRNASHGFVEAPTIQKTMGIRQQVKYQGTRLARFEQDQMQKQKLRYTNTFDEKMQNEFRKMDSKTQKLKNSFNYMRQQTSIIATANQKVIQKAINQNSQDQLVMSKSYSSHSKLTLQKNISQKSKKEEQSQKSKKDEKQESFVSIPVQGNRIKFEDTLQEYEDNLDVISDVESLSEVPDQSAMSHNFEQTQTSKIKDEYGGCGIAEEQEFINLKFEVKLTQNNHLINSKLESNETFDYQNNPNKLELKVINTMAREDRFDHLPFFLISKNRVQIYEDQTDFRSQSFKSQGSQFNWLCMDALEISQKVDNLIKGKYDFTNERPPKLNILSTQKAKLIQNIVIYLDKLSFDQINQMNTSISNFDHQKISYSDLLQGQPIIEEDESIVSSPDPSHKMYQASSFKNTKMIKDQSIYSVNSLLSYQPQNENMFKVMNKNTSDIKLARQSAQFGAQFGISKAESVKTNQDLQIENQSSQIEYQSSQIEHQSSLERSDTPVVAKPDKQVLKLDLIKKGEYKPEEKEEEEEYKFEGYGSEEDEK